MLDEETKFIRTKEDKYKEARISITNDTQTVNKQGESLAILEEWVNVENGLWIEFSKAPPPEPEDAKKKAAKPKKGAVEPEKPIQGRAWLDLTKIKMPGGTEITQRCYFRTVESDATQKDFFEHQKTYIYICLKLSIPINAAKKEIINLEQLIPKKAPLPKYPVPKDCVEEFNMQIQLAIEALSKEYLKYIGGIESKSEFQLSNPQEEEKRTATKNKFMHDLNTSGKFQILMEKLKRSIVKIVREKFSVKSSLKGISFTENDKLFSDLYSYMVDQLKSTVNNIVAKKKDLLHTDITATKETEEERLQALSTKSIQETPTAKLLRLCKEYVFRQDYITAEKYYLAGIKLNERDLTIWIRYYHFLCTIHNNTKALTALKECLSIEPENKDFNLLYAATLLVVEKYKESELYLNKLLIADNTDISTNLLLSLLYEAQGNKNVSDKYLAMTLRRKKRDLNIIPLLGKLKDGPLPATRELTSDEIDSLYISVSSFFLKHKTFDICYKLLSKVKSKETSEYQMQMCQVKYKIGDYKETTTMLTALLAKDPQNVKAISLKGSCHYESKEYDAAEEAFIRVIRLNPKGKLNSLFLKLGKIYMTKKLWMDANVVFYSACQQANTSYGWENLGLCYLNMEKYDDSEKCLNNANILDNKNADIWCNLAIVCLRKKKNTQALQCIREALKLEITSNEIAYSLISELVKCNMKERATEFYEAISSKLKITNTMKQSLAKVGISTTGSMIMEEEHSPLERTKKEANIKAILQPQEHVRRTKVGAFSMNHNGIAEAAKITDCIMVENNEEATQSIQEAKVANKSAFILLKHFTLRIGKIKNGSVQLERGKHIQLTSSMNTEGDSAVLPINMPTIASLPKGALIYLMGGSITLKVLTTEKEITAEISNSGLLMQESRAYIPLLALPPVAPTCSIDPSICNFVCINASTSEDIIKAKENLKGGVMAVIYNEKGIENIKEIMQQCDGVLIDQKCLSLCYNMSLLNTQNSIISIAKEHGKFAYIYSEFVLSLPDRGAN